MPIGSLTLAVEKRSKAPEGSRKKQVRKTRTFAVRLLGFMAADGLWDGPVSGSATRPAWIAYVESRAATRAFTANFRAGRPALLGQDRRFEMSRFEITRRARYRWTTQDVGDGVVTVAYLPELFHLEPTEPAPERVRFVFAPPTWWLDREEEALRAQLGTEAREAARAALFARYLDRRTRLPLMHDLGFLLRLYRAARQETGVEEARSSIHARGLLYAEGLEECGLEDPLAVSIRREALEQLIVRVTEKHGTRHLPSTARTSHLDPENPHGPSRLPADRRLLPDAPAPATADCLDASLAG